MQKNIKVENYNLPIIVDGHNTWYPITFVFEKIIKSSSTNGIIKKYKDYIRKYEVDYSQELNMKNIQNSNCICKEGLIKVLNNMNIGAYYVDRKEKLNLIRSLVGIELIDVRESVISVEEFDWRLIENYDEYIKDIIIKCKGSFTKWKKCIKCNKYYPLHEMFYILDKRNGKYMNSCKDCYGGGIISKNEFLTRMYKSYGDEIYKEYQTHNTVFMYNHYFNEKYDCILPDILFNKEDYKSILLYLLDKGLINQNKISENYFHSMFSLRSVYSFFTMPELYELLYGDKPINYPWLFKNYKINHITQEELKNVFSRYIDYNNIEINDVFNFDYANTLKKCGVRNKVLDNTLSFIVSYYDHKYAAYQFNEISVKYWKDKHNRIREMRYYIEKDLCLQIEKIPLYVTKYKLRKDSNTLYNVLKNYYINLWEWINECYPSKFIPEDFDINHIRREFGSIEERVIDEILRNKYGGNLIYNPIHTENTIKIITQIPDWFILTSKGVWIVEYFGLIDKRRNTNNKRINQYRKRHDRKIEIYNNQIEGYRYLYLYPTDLENSCKGLKEKIEEIDLF